MITQSSKQLQQRLDKLSNNQPHTATIAIRDDTGMLRGVDGNPINARQYSTIHVIVSISA